MTISPPEITNPPLRSWRPASIALGLILMAFAVSLCLASHPAADLFWQIRAGHDIAASHHAPAVDAFSWTRRGRPWIAHEWLCFLLFWETYQLGGFSALWILEACLVAATVGVVYLQALRETQAPITAFLLTAMCAVLASDFFQPRPHLFTYLFLAVTVTVLQRMRAGASPRGRAWILIPVFVIWSNLHAGSIVGVAVLAAFAAGDVLDSRRLGAERRPLLERARFTALLAAGCALATIVNPYGPRIYENLWSTVSNSTAMNLVLEWSSPNFHDPGGKSLEMFLALIVYAVAFTRRAREAGPSLVLALLIYESLSAVRNIPLLAVAGALLIAGDLQSSLTRHVPHPADAREFLFGRLPSAVAVTAVSIAFCVLAASHAVSAFRDDGRSGMAVLPRIAGDDFGFDYFPSDACDFMETERFPTSMNLYNIYDFGGYLIWRLPQYPVFIDGRADVYFGKVLEDANRLQGLSYHWSSILDGYGCDAIFTVASKAQTYLYLNSPDWTLVYADRSDLNSNNGRVNALIFIRSSPKYAALIARCRAHCPAAVAVSAQRAGSL